MAKEYTSKRAQLQHAQSLDEALTNIHSNMHYFVDKVSALENRIKTGKSNDSYKYQSTQELLAECTADKSDVRSAITKLKGIDPENSSIADYEAQYKEYCKHLATLSDKVADMPLKKSSRKRKVGEDNNSEDEPSESDLQKQYIASLHFDAKNVDKLANQLGQLSNKIITEFLRFSLSRSNYKLARSKFKEGLLILRKLEPDNTMVAVYDEQIKEWNKKHRSNIIKRLFGWIGIIIGIAIFISICMIMDDKK